MNTHRRQKTISCLITSIVSLGVFMTAPSWAGGWHNIPGTACSAFNNYQANELQRSHVRIYNPPTNYRGIYVICPIQRVVEDIQSTTSMVRGYINVYFNDQSASTAQVACGVRDFDYLTTHAPGVVSPGGVINAVSVIAQRPSTVPGISQPSWFFTVDDTTIRNFWTVTCGLPPGTGINSIDVYQY